MGTIIIAEEKNWGTERTPQRVAQLLLKRARVQI